MGQQSADSRLPLDATMKFLQEKLNEQGKMNWTTLYHDSADSSNWSYTFTFEVAHVSADAATCSVGYHYKVTRDSAVLGERDAQFNLHDVQNLTLIPAEQRQKKNDLAAGHTTWSAKVNPPMFDLIVQAKEHAEFYFLLRDEDTANRVSKAMKHAVELCGGSRP